MLLKSVSEKLAKLKLKVNESETEQYTIPEPQNTARKKSCKVCKLLGSLLET